VGGVFTGANSIGGATRSLFARLSNDTVALQNLAATQTTITWTRGGSSPQFARVTFEYSTDNVNYTLLGNGTAAGSNWTLTGLSLATGQNLYIRARGYYDSGQQNGSESITQSVRNAFVGVGPLLQVIAITRSGTDDIAVTFAATTAETYRLERKLDLTDASWQSISGVSDFTAVNNGPAQIIDPGAVSLGRAFYRVRLLP
jgi:hypothetical protein